MASIFCYHRLFNLAGYLFFLLLLSNAFYGVQSNPEEKIRNLQEQQSNEELNRFDEVMKMLMADSNAPGAQLAVAKGGQLKYFKAFGVANRDNGEPVTTHHVMRYNSISKVITGTAILKLVQEGKEGKVSLDDKPFRFLENLIPPKGGWNRTSTGIDIAVLPAALYVSQSLGRPPPPTKSESIRFMKGIPLDFDPGSAMEYSNFGYLVLGRVIERVTGMNYGDYIKQRIFHSLGITEIKLGQSMLEHLAPNEVRYYGINGEDSPFVSIFPGQGFVNSSYGLIDYSNVDSYGGWIGNAGDLVRFVDHIDGLRLPAILNKEMVYSMLNAPMPSNRGILTSIPLFDHSRGLDVFVVVDKKSGNVTGFQHSGGAPGAHSFVMRLMAENITFAFLLNTSPVSPLFDIVAVGNLSEVARSIVNWPHYDLFHEIG